MVFSLVDDARLLLGIHYHGFGNWEKIRLDERLGLSKKIAPAELQHHETFLPRAPNLKDRANALLEMVSYHLESRKCQNWKTGLSLCFHPVSCCNLCKALSPLCMYAMFILLNSSYDLNYCHNRREYIN